MMKGITAGGLSVILALAAGAATAGPAKQADNALALPLQGDVVNPDWRSQPNGDDLYREYPPLAQVMNMTGSATMTCTVEVDGRLDECRVVQETPAGLGFGAAVLRMAAYFIMNPARIDGRPVKGKVTIPITFKLADAGPKAAEPPAIPPPTSPAALDLARQAVALENVEGRLQALYRPALDQMSARIAVDGDAKASEAVLDAYRQGLQDAITQEADQRARLMAARMSKQDLQATLAYLQSPAGKGWLAAVAEDEAPGRPNLMMRAAQAARGHLCAEQPCDGNETPAPAGAAGR